jgi:hypothetical protein
MLQLLTQDTVQVPQVEVELLEGLDKMLKSILVPGKFIWDDTLTLGFPQKTFWYLYGQLRVME